MLRLFLRLGFVMVFSCSLAVASLIWLPPGWTENVGGRVPSVADGGSLGERIEAGKDGGGAGITEKIEVWTEKFGRKLRQSMAAFLSPVTNIRAVMRCGNLMVRAGAIFLFFFLWQR